MMTSSLQAPVTQAPKHPHTKGLSEVEPSDQLKMSSLRNTRLDPPQIGALMPSRAMRR